MEIKVTINVEAPELVKAINNLAAALGGAKTVQPAVMQQPTLVPTQAAPVPPAAVPVSAPPQYTKEQIMQAGAELMDAGKADELVKLLKTFNVRAVMELKPEQLGAFATAMRELGAKI